MTKSAALKDRYATLSDTANEATGYAEIFAHLNGAMTLEETIEQIKIATRQLARKQMKWFRRFPNVRWIAGDQPAEAIATQILGEGLERCTSSNVEVKDPPWRARIVE